MFSCSERTVDNVHDGGAIWSLCLQASGQEETAAPLTVLSGGSDAAVRSVTFSCDGPPPPPEVLHLNRDTDMADFPKHVVSVGETQVVVLTDRGILYLCDKDSSSSSSSNSGSSSSSRESNSSSSSSNSSSGSNSSNSSSELVEIYRNASLASYAVVSAVCDEKGDGRLLLGNLTGQVFMLRLTAGGHLSQLLEATVCAGKIFAASLLSPTEFLISEGSGQLGVWDVVIESGADLEQQSDAKAVLKARGKLPEMKHPWVTSARLWMGYYVVGDRCGGVWFYTVGEGGRLLPRQSFHRLHGPQGVTDICATGYVPYCSGSCCGSAFNSMLRIRDPMLF
jgi:hypothetical protein